LLQNDHWKLRDAQTSNFEIARIKDELSTTSQQLAHARSERDRCFKALEEAHECVSEYHKKLGRMEKSVGHALVARGEVKDLQGRLDEMTNLNQEYKNMLCAAEGRIQDLASTEQAVSSQASDLARQVTFLKEQAVDLQTGTSISSERVVSLEKALQDTRDRLKNALVQADEAEKDRGCAELNRQDALEALADMVELHKRSEEERAGMQARMEQELSARQVLQVCMLLLKLLVRFTVLL
jgi:chromosome segregation ATPase